MLLFGEKENRPFQGRFRHSPPYPGALLVHGQRQPGGYGRKDDDEHNGDAHTDDIWDSSSENLGERYVGHAFHDKEIDSERRRDAPEIHHNADEDAEPQHVPVIESSNGNKNRYAYEHEGNRRYETAEEEQDQENETERQILWQLKNRYAVGKQHGNLAESHEIADDGGSCQDKEAHGDVFGGFIDGVDKFAPCHSAHAQSNDEAAYGSDGSAFRRSENSSVYAADDEDEQCKNGQCQAE